MKKLYRIVWAVAFLAAIVSSGMTLAFAPYMASLETRLQVKH